MKKRVKILQVVGAMNRAGTETMLMNLYRHIDHEHIQFDFVSYSDQIADYDNEIEALGGTVIRLSKSNSVSQLYQAIKQHGPYQAVHAHTLFHCGIALLAAFLAGVKIRIAHAHTTLDKNDHVIRKLYIHIMRFVIRLFSTRLLACSNRAGAYLFGNKMLTKTTYCFFPNVIAYERFLQPQKSTINRFKVEHGLGTSIVIGHIGRFIDAKNHRFLFKIMAELVKVHPTLQLLLVGDGDLREEMEKQAEIQVLKNNIQFIGKTDDIPTMLHCMDVFVFPSKYEGLGLVLLEAQAAGIPCIVSEAIQPEADIGIDLITSLPLADGEKAWATSILSLVGKKERNQQKIKNGFERKGYAIPVAIDTLMEHYQIETGGAYEETVNRLL